MGYVRSVDRVVMVHRFGRQYPKNVQGRVLKNGKSINGYHHVTLRRDNKGHTSRVHLLVAEAFLGTKPPGYVIHHKDGNKINNCAGNLEFVTLTANTRMYHESKGAEVKVKVPYGDIPDIHRRVHAGETVLSIAKSYNLSRDDISVLFNRISLTGKELTEKQ